MNRSTDAARALGTALTSGERNHSCYHLMVAGENFLGQSQH